MQLLSDSVELISQFSKDSYITSVLRFGTHKLDFSDIFERLRELQELFDLKGEELAFGTKEDEIKAENEDWKVRHFFDPFSKVICIHTVMLCRSLRRAGAP